MKTTSTDQYNGNITQNYFTAYVEKALKNNRVSYYRKYKSHQKSELLYGSEDQIATYTIIHTEISDVISEKHPLHFDFIQTPGLAKELRNLPKKALAIIRMRIVCGYSYKTIGAILGMKEDAVRVRYFRAIQKIRNNMKGEQK